MVLVMKPDDSVRICINYKAINAGTINDGYPITRADDLLRKMAPSSYITTLDATASYYQIEMEEDSIPYTSFITHRGQFAFRFMSFELKTAGNTFQRMIDDLLSRHQEYSLGYIDDVSVFSGEWKTHLTHLAKVLNEFQELRLTLKLKKCYFGRPKVQFLGYIVGSGDISVVPDKIMAIQKMPEPVTKKLLSGFIGMCSYYRAFIPLFSDTALPLTELTKGGKTGRIAFNDSERAAFVRLKELLCSSQVLGSP